MNEKVNRFLNGDYKIIISGFVIINKYIKYEDALYISYCLN